MNAIQHYDVLSIQVTNQSLDFFCYSESHLVEIVAICRWYILCPNLFCILCL